MILDHMNSKIHHLNSNIHILSHDKFYENKIKFIKIHIINNILKLKHCFHKQKVYIKLL